MNIKLDTKLSMIKHKIILIFDILYSIEKNI